MGDKLRIDRRDYAIATLPVRKHWRSPTITADDFPGKNSLTTKSVIVKLELWLRDRPKDRAGSKK